MYSLIASLRRGGKGILRNGMSPVATPLPHHNDQRMGRICLVCQGRFVSTWTGERICPACRSVEESKGRRKGDTGPLAAREK
jgi:hypothetical protein